jgi:hypothetical protein
MAGARAAFAVIDAETGQDITAVLLAQAASVGGFSHIKTPLGSRLLALGGLEGHIF